MGSEESPHCPFDVMEACRTGGPGGQQEIGGGGGGGGGAAAEEMDQDGADDGGGVRPPWPGDWKTRTIRQKKNWKLRSGRRGGGAEGTNRPPDLKSGWR